MDMARGLGYPGIVACVVLPLVCLFLSGYPTTNSTAQSHTQGITAEQNEQGNPDGEWAF